MKEDKELRAQLEKIEKLLINGSSSASKPTSSKSSKISDKVCMCVRMFLCMYAPTRPKFIYI